MHAIKKLYFAIGNNPLLPINAMHFSEHSRYPIEVSVSINRENVSRCSQIAIACHIVVREVHRVHIGHRTRRVSSLTAGRPANHAYSADSMRCIGRNNASDTELERIPKRVDHYRSCLASSNASIYLLCRIGAYVHLPIYGATCTLRKRTLTVHGSRVWALTNSVTSPQ